MNKRPFDGIVFLVFCLLLAFAMLPMPWARMSRGGHPGKHCYTNMRVILGAVEMYNMDHSSMISRLNSGTIGMLQSTGYLKSDTRCTGDQQPRFNSPWVTRKLYTLAQNLLLNGDHIAFVWVPGGIYSGEDLTGEGRIVCSVHGTVEE